MSQTTEAGASISNISERTTFAGSYPEMGSNASGIAKSLLWRQRLGHRRRNRHRKLQQLLRHALRRRVEAGGVVDTTGQRFIHDEIERIEAWQVITQDLGRVEMRVPFPHRLRRQGG